MQELKDTNFDFLGPKKTGKVRDIYDQGEQLILISTDRHSSFDRIIADIIVFSSPFMMKAPGGK